MKEVIINLNAELEYANPITGVVEKPWVNSITNDNLKQIIHQGLDNLADRIDRNVYKRVNISALVEDVDTQMALKQEFERMSSKIGFKGSIEAKPEPIKTRNGERYSVKLWRDPVQSSGFVLQLG